MTSGDWMLLHKSLLEKTDFLREDVLEAEKCLRWWTIQARGDSGEEAVASAFSLYDHVNTLVREKDIIENDGKLVERRRNVTGSPFLWLEGDYPRAMHVFNAILDAWRLASASSPNPMEMFERLKNADDIELNARSYSLVMRAVMDNSKKTLSPLLCQKIFIWMQQAEEPRFIPAQKSIRPDCVALSMALHAWGKSGRTDAAEQVELLFNDYVQVCHQFPNGDPNTYAYNTLLNAILARTHRVLSLPERRLRLERAELFFQGMLENKFKNVFPTNLSFHHMIFAWSDYYAQGRQNGTEMTAAIDEACSLLERLVHLYRETKTEYLAPHPRMFGKIISVLATSNSDPKSLKRAEKLYRHMQTLHAEDGDPAFEPDVNTIRAILKTYCKMGLPKRAEQHLDRLENDPNMDARVSHYRDVMLAWIKEASKRKGRNDARIKATQNAQRFLERVISRAHSTGCKHILPTRDFITKILELWQGCGRPEQAEALLREIVTLHEKTGFSVLKPREAAFRRVMAAYASVGRDFDGLRAEKVEGLLQELQKRYREGDKEMNPTVFAYNEAVAAWARTERKDRLEKCLAILESARSSYNADTNSVRPDTPLYGAVMKACSRSGKVDTAVQLLRQMVEDYNDGNRSARPNIGILNMMILTCLLSGEERRDERALRIYHMIDNLNKEFAWDLQPNERTLSLMAEIMAKSTNPDRVQLSGQFVKKMHLIRQSQRTHSSTVKGRRQ